MNPEIAKAIAAIRAQGGDDADVEAYLRSVGAQEVDPATAAIQDMNKQAELSARASEREAKNAEEKKLTGADRLGANLQRFTDMATFGVSGLLDDLVSPGSFAANRQARRMAQEGLPTMDRVASSLTGAVANPVGAVIRVPAGAGLLSRMGRTSADAALQGGAQGAVENLDDLSAEGLKRAGQGGLLGAAGGALGVQAARGLMSVARGANTVRRVVQAKPLDITRWEMEDAMKGADDFFYGITKEEAAKIGSTPALREALEMPIVRDFVALERARPRNANATDAELFLAAYRRMSEVEGQKIGVLEGSAIDRAKSRADMEDIADMKVPMREATERSGQVVVPGRAMSAPAPTTAQSPPLSLRDALDAFRARGAEAFARKEGTVMQQTAREGLLRHDRENIVSPSLRGAPQPMRSVVRESETIDLPGAMPTFNLANATHAGYRGQMEAFEDVADGVQRIMRKSAQKGQKIKLESPEALRRAILDMTPAEAEAAIDGVLGRARESWKLSSNMLTGFGIPGAAVRTAIMPAQVNPYLRLLAKQAGRKPRLFDNPVVMERGLGALARTTGSASGGLLDR